jgi:hypothetical protein
MQLFARLSITNGVSGTGPALSEDQEAYDEDISRSCLKRPVLGVEGIVVACALNFKVAIVRGVLWTDLLIGAQW